ncbi:MAG TPA: hypothetical protein VF806_09735 [Anaerolineaceae bacterium]
MGGGLKTRLIASGLPAGSGPLAGSGVRARGRKAAPWFALASLLIAQLACARGFVSPTQLTATAAGPGGLTADITQPLSVATTADPPMTPTSNPPASPRVDLQPVAPDLQATPTLAPVVETPTPVATETATATIDPAVTSEPPILYYTQAGDTLQALASRFNVSLSDITSPEPIVTHGLFNPGVLLLIPHRLGETSSSKQLIPDSEVVYSPSALDFDIDQFVKNGKGYLTTYKEWRSNGWYDGAGVIRRVAIENSINPRLLLVILERQSHWVYGQPKNLAETDFPIGWLRLENDKKGLYYQLSWAVSQLNKGYYGWRDGTVTELTFPDGSKLRLAPDLNAGTVGLLYLFSRLYNQVEWAGILYGTDGLMAQYETMVGSPYLRAQSVEPLFPATLTQPPLSLPFLPGHTWSFTGGPHWAWGPDGARAALDFAPSATDHGCYQSDDWVTAMAPGLVVRSENGVVIVDLDGDGYEQTGWDILYLHIATLDRVPKGTWVNQNDHIGHPSCEGGNATGTHTHIARKYNGEWILADGPMPFTMDGWVAHANKDLYQGYLVNASKVVIASQVGSFESRITRPLISP